jgi:hypothetical protein
MADFPGKVIPLDAEPISSGLDADSSYYKIQNDDPTIAIPHLMEKDFDGIQPQRPNQSR